MERVARSEGDIDSLIAVKQRDLSSAHDYLALADLHLSAGRPEEAVRWAGSGVEAYPDGAGSSGLNDFLVTVYAKLGRHEASLALLWKGFTEAGGTEEFHKLKEYVQQKDAAAWPGWRERVLKHLRGSGTKAAAGTDRNLLIEVLLEEGLDEEAWAEARTGGCRSGLWLEVAARRERTHPADALKVYQEQLGPIIARSDQQAYREAVTLLIRIGSLLDQLGRADDFGTYRAEVRAANRQKRSFLKLLDGIKLPPHGKRGGAKS